MSEEITTNQESNDTAPSDLAPVSAEGAATGSTPNPIDKTSIVKVEKKPEEDLRVKTARQITEYFTSPGWPKLKDLTKPINMIMRGDGIWELRKNAVGLFCVKKYDQKFPGFPKEDNYPWFYPWYGKIPFNLLQQILYFFKEICDESNDEVFVQIFWDPENKRYFNHVPKQEVSSGSVKYDHEVEVESKNILCGEIHSHNTMGAFFSGVDDADEKRDQFYGVIGELNKRKPAITLSFVCGGKRQLIGVDHLFTEAPAEEQLFPQEWKKRVTKSNSRFHSGSNETSYANWPGYGHNQNHSGRTSGNDSDGGAFKFQSSRHASADSRPQTQQEREEGSTQGARGSSEASGRLTEEIERLKRELDADIKPVDFVDRPPAAEPEEVSANPFFPGSGDQARALVSNSKYHENDEVFAASIGQVIDTLLVHYTRGLEMNKNERKELLNSLVAGMQDDDIRCLVSVIAEHNVDLIMESIGAYAVEAQKSGEEG